MTGACLLGSLAFFEELSTKSPELPPAEPPEEQAQRQNENPVTQQQRGVNPPKADPSRPGQHTGPGG